MIKLPRGRVPATMEKMQPYIQRVASENGVTFEAAEKVIRAKYPDVFHGAPVSGGVKAAPAAPKLPKMETDAEVVARISERFDTMFELMHGACSGSVRSLVVSGVGGVGKTHMAEQVIGHYTENEGIKSEVVHGVLTPVHLYMLLYRNRDKNAVVVLDDADGIFKDEDALSILKAALDTGLSRKISWKAQSKALADAGIPDAFLYEGSMVFLTNLDFQRMVDSGKGNLVPHMQAIMTRAYYMDLELHSQRELLLWINHVVKKNHILVQMGLTHEDEKTILAYMNENRDKLRNLSIRTALKLAGFMKMSKSNWQQMAANIELRPKYQWDNPE